MSSKHHIIKEMGTLILFDFLVDVQLKEEKQNKSMNRRLEKGLTNYMWPPLHYTCDWW